MTEQLAAALAGRYSIERELGGGGMFARIHQLPVVKSPCTQTPAGTRSWAGSAVDD